MADRKTKRLRPVEPHGVKRSGSFSNSATQLESEMSDSWLDRWFSRASNFSQVLMLLLVAFGYFYTVRPVYQKDLLEEDLAKLTLDADRIAKQNKAAEVRSTRLQTEIFSLQAERQQLIDQRKLAFSANEALAAQSRALKEKTNALDQELGRTTELNSRQLAQIKANQAAMLRSNLNLFLLPSVMDRDGDFDSLPFGDRSDQEKWVHKDIKQPFQLLLDLIDGEISNQRFFGLPEPRSVSREVVEDLRTRVQLVSKSLTCPTADKRAWLGEFRRQTKEANETIDECVEFHIHHFSQAEKWSIAQLRHAQTSDAWKSWRADTARKCDVMASYHVERRFNDAWEKFMGPCTKRVFYGVLVADGINKELEAFGPATPPSFDATWFRDWY
jgi:hypothetical protein